MGLRKRIKQHKFESYLIAFLIMIIPPVPAFYAALRGDISTVWALLFVIILGNMLVLLID